MRANVGIGPSIPTTPNVGATARWTMHGVGRMIFATSLAPLSFIKNLGLKSVAAVVAADALRHA